jgi:deazaflavin-dependent oxidoreductase (nitroreductase family)
VAAIRDGDDAWLVAASKGGAPENPAWYHNLLANPDAEIETPDDGTVAVHAVDLHGQERDDAWERFKQRSEGFRSYEQRTSRTIPVLRLTRRTS